MSPLKKKLKDVRPKASPPKREKPAPPTTNGHDIAVRAYELFIQRGGQHGNDWEDWFNAEQQLVGRD